MTGRAGPIAILASCLLTFAGTCTRCAAQVLLRGSGTPLPGEVAKVEDEGVFLREAGTFKIISWDRVREVRGVHAGEAAVFVRRIGEPLWRARSRIERGDMQAAAPIIPAIAAEYAKGQGPTAVLAHELALRSTLFRGESAGAVWAFLDLRSVLSRAIDKNQGPPWVAASGTADLPPVIDQRTGLCPDLPPIWLSGPATDAGARAPEWAQREAASDEPGVLAKLYHASMLAESAAVVVPEVGVSEGGTRLVYEIVAARAGEAQARLAARAALESRLATEMPAWMEAWVRIGLGRSLVLDAEPDAKRRGVLHLLHVPARFSRTSPRLAALALAEASRVMKELRDDAAAANLRAELARRHPRTPEARWAPIQDIALPTPQTPGSENAGQGVQAPGGTP